MRLLFNFTAVSKMRKKSRGFLHGERRAVGVRDPAALVV